MFISFNCKSNNNSTKSNDNNNDNSNNNTGGPRGGVHWVHVHPPRLSKTKSIS